jgi:hypothetical protein
LVRLPPMVPRLRTAIGYAGRDGTHGAIGDVGNTAILDVSMGDAGANHQAVLHLLRSLQLLQGGDVDDELGLYQPQVQHGPERLAAG